MSQYPYAGLRPFKREETDIFFGREKHTDELLSRLSQQHFLAVIGTSGCGKSSLVKTGLIPSLEAGFLNIEGTHWKIAEMRPSNQPFKNLADALIDEKVLGEIYSTALIQNEFLKRGAFSLHELLAIQPLPNKAKLLIVCDQFEEIFRYYEKGVKTEAEAFVSLLLASSKPHHLPDNSISNDIYVVLTMRSDFLGDCALFTGLAEAINNGLYLTPRLNREQLRLAIEEPALMFDGEVEPELTVKLLDDIANNSDQLPLLQHILMRLWLQAKHREPILLTLEDYQSEEIGGFDKALSNHADEILKDLKEKGKENLVKILFCSLCERQSEKRDTRRIVKLKELMELANVSAQEIIEIIKVFQQEGSNFLVSDKDLTPESMIDISHESLIRQWNTLKEWVEKETDNAKIYLRLEDRASQWNNGKADFLTSTELDIFLQWYNNQDNKPNKIWAKRYDGDFVLAERFLLASEEAREKEIQAKEQEKLNNEQLQKTANDRLKYFSVLMGLVVVVLMGSGGYWYYSLYEKEYVTYCRDMSTDFGIVECRGKLSEQEKKPDSYYKLYQTGTSNPVENVIYIYYNGESRSKYNKVKQTEMANFGADGKPVLYYGDEHHKWTASYDEKGNQIEQAYFGVDDKPILYKDGNNQQYHKWIKKYDDKGNKTEQAYFGADGKPVLYIDSEGNVYHKWTASYDDKGNQTEEAYFGADDKPVLYKDNYGNQYQKWTKRYDEKGNQTEEAYFGADDKPVLYKDGYGGKYHKWTASYDEKDNRIVEQAYFDIAEKDKDGKSVDKPTLYKDGEGNEYHKWKKVYYKFKENDKAVEQYFDVKNEEVFPKSCNKLNKLSSYYIISLKDYNKGKEIFSIALKQCPDRLILLSNDLELSLIQYDRARFQERFKKLTTLLKKTDENYSIIYFLNYLSNPKQDYQLVIKAIEKSNNNRPNWDFEALKPFIDDIQNEKTKKVANLFIAYFENPQDLNKLKTDLTELEK